MGNQTRFDLFILYLPLTEGLINHYSYTSAIQNRSAPPMKPIMCQNAMEVPQNKHPSSDETMDPNDGSASSSNTWPEDSMHGFWPRYVFSRWTYSYLNPLLRKGSLQKKGGLQIDQESLFHVPQSMSSTLLNDHFRYVYFIMNAWTNGCSHKEERRRTSYSNNNDNKSSPILTHNQRSFYFQNVDIGKHLMPVNLINDPSWPRYGNYPPLPSSRRQCANSSWLYVRWLYLCW